MVLANQNTLAFFPTPAIKFSQIFEPSHLFIQNLVTPPPPFFQTPPSIRHSSVTLCYITMCKYLYVIILESILTYVVAFIIPYIQLTVKPSKYYLFFIHVV